MIDHIRDLCCSADPGLEGKCRQVGEMWGSMRRICWIGRVRKRSWRVARDQRGGDGKRI